jgi:CheY-like chemotaxis protein
MEATMRPQQQPTPAIVVVDDEPDSVHILSRIVRDMTEGYRVIVASSGAEVLAQISARPITLVIADYSMPAMDGLQRTTTIKARSQETCVILTTAYDIPDMEKRAQVAHVDYCLPKPFPSTDWSRRSVRRSPPDEKEGQECA